MSELPIETTNRGCAEWHMLNIQTYERTAAMNTPSGAVLRVCALEREGLAVATTLLPGVSVAHRWTADVREADPDEGIKASILLTREVALMKAEEVGFARVVLIVTFDRGRFTGTAFEGAAAPPITVATRASIHRELHKRSTWTKADAFRTVDRIIGDGGGIDVIRIESDSSLGRETVEVDLHPDTTSKPEWVNADEDLPRPSDAEIRAMAGVEVDEEAEEAEDTRRGCRVEGPDDDGR